MSKHRDHVGERFPGQRWRLQVLRRTDQRFAELCADYNEVCAALQFGWGDSVPGVAGELLSLRRELERDLEEAINGGSGEG